VRKFLPILIALVVTSASVLAQAPAGGGAKPPAGAKPGAGAPGGIPTLGRAFGRVTDSTGSPIEQASVMLLKAGVDPVTKKKKLTLIKGMDTKASGEFNFEDLPIMGPLVLKVSATGYIAKDQTFTIFVPGAQKPAASTAPAGQNANPMANLPNFEKNLGDIKLIPQVTELKGVVIQATPPALKLDMDKKVFNVEKNLTSAGGTAVDVMRNVPSVNVDIDGNVSLRGSSPTIFVDGRPTTLTLDEIPADAIESVEVISNPGAKYDASTTGGILNIVLKKNRKSGYNGNISAGVDSHGALNALGSFNVRQNKLNFSATLLYNANKSKTTGTTHRNTDLSTNMDTVTQLYESDKTNNGGGFAFGQFGVDYFVTNKTTISASYLHVHGAIKPNETSQLQTDTVLNGIVSPTYYSTRYSNTNLQIDVNGATAGMKHNWDKQGENITADASFFAANATSTANYLTNYWPGAPEANMTPVFITQQQVLSTGDPRFFTFQSDYTNPIGAKSKLEAGIRASIQTLNNLNNTYTADETGKYILDTLAASNYSSTSRVYAGYVNWTSAIGNFGYQLGLRGESSNYSGKLLTNDTSYSNSYPLSLFPTVFLSQKWGKGNELQFSATRKITRPNFMQLIPYTNYSDTLNITRGNPGLVPQFSYDFEFNYLKTMKHNNTLLFTIYYNYTSNLITHYQQPGINPQGEAVLINTFKNADDSYSYGAEATSTDNITKWWDLSLNANVYNSYINTSNLDQPSQAAMWAFFGKWNNNFKLPADFTIQLTGTYQSKTSLPVNQGGQSFGPNTSTTQSASQGYIKAFYGVDMAIKKSFLKNNAASLTLSISDIFRSRWSDQFSESQYFNQEFDRLKDPQLVRLVFAYHFGKMDLNLFKRKDMNSQGMGDAGSSLQ
jgi:ferric enterobactin receptor